MFRPTSAYSGISVDDVDAAVAFYGGVLGLSVRVLASGQMAQLELPGSDVPVLVYGKPHHQPASFTVLNFPVADVEAAVDDLRSRGVDTKIYDDADFPADSRGIMREGGPLIAWFRDPAGNVLAVLDE